MRWLGEVGLLEVDFRVKGEDSEKKRIEVMMGKFESSVMALWSGSYWTGTAVV